MFYGTPRHKVLVVAWHWRWALLIQDRPLVIFPVNRHIHKTGMLLLVILLSDHHNQIFTHLQLKYGYFERIYHSFIQYFKDSATAFVVLSAIIDNITPFEGNLSQYDQRTLVPLRVKTHLQSTGVTTRFMQ